MQLRPSRTSGPCVLLVFLALLSPLEAAGGQLFSDDFAGNLNAQWTVVDEGTSLAPSQWRVKGGVLEQTTDIYGATSDALAQPGTYLLTGSSEWTGYRVSVRMRTVGDDDSIGVMFGYQGPGNYYRFSMDRQTARRQLVKLVNGVATLLAEDGVAYAKNTWYSVEARLTGGIVEILIDGSSVFRVSDVSHNSGKIALYSWWNTGARFDDVEVNPDEGAESCSYAVAPGELIVGGGSQKGSVKVTANSGCAWKATSNAAWLHVSGGASGAGSGNIAYTADANPGTASRRATLKVGGHNLLVTQNAAVAPLTAPVLFEDAFATDLSANWSVVDEGTTGAPSEWKVTSGVLQQTTNISGDESTAAMPGTYLLAGDETWTGYSVNLRVMSSDDDSIGIMFGYKDPGNYYRFSMDKQRAFRRLVKLVDGVPTVLAEDNVAFETGTWYSIQAKLLGGAVEIWIDGVRIFQKTDASHSAGKIALYAFHNAGANFDDVQVMSETVVCDFTISPVTKTIPSGVATGSVTVTTTAGCAWTATSNDSWITITSGNKGTGSGSVAYSVLANADTADRNGTLTIAGKTFTLTQQAPPVCNYVINPVSAYAGPAASTGKVTVTVAAGCPWSAVSSAAWLPVTSGANGSGNGIVNYSVQANKTAAQRQATLTIGGQTFTLTQISASGCQFTVNPTSITGGPGTNAATFNVLTSPGCTWSVANNPSWISGITPRSGTKSSVVNFTMQANPNQTERTATLTVAGASVTVKQFASGVPNVYYVAPGSNLQKALDQAQPGDTITLAPGAVYSGTFFLRRKTGTEYITITTADPSLLPPAGTRISPAYSGSLPKVSASSTSPVFRTDPGAHHYKIIGLEIQSPGKYNWDLIRLGSDTVTDVTNQASDFVLDQLYMHGDPVLGAKRGVTLNSANTVIKNCYIEEIKGVGQETQAILGYNGPGPYEIVNNYLEAAGENIMFGGALARIPGLVPSDILIKGNHLTKKLSWRKGNPGFTKLWTVKNIIELKNARRVTIDSNIFENNWLQAQAGYAIVMTVRTQSGKMPWAVVEDILFTRNIVRNSGAGVNILGQDYNGRYLGIARRITFRDNVFENIDYRQWGGDGRLVQVQQAAEDVTFDHNTFVSNNVKIAVSVFGSPLVRFSFTNNILPHGISGVYGTGKGTGTAALNYYSPGALYTKNVMANAPTRGYLYPSGNYFPPSFLEVKFTDLTSGDYSLTSASPYKGAASDGTDIGANFKAVNSATATAKR